MTTSPPLAEAHSVPSGASFPAFRIAACYGALSGLGGALVVPYLASMLPAVAEAPLPLWALAVLQGLQSAGLATLLGYLGLRCGLPLGLPPPLLAYRLTGVVRTHPSCLRRAAVLGLLGGLAVLALDVWGFARHLPIPATEMPTPGPLLGLLASLYGGIAEEVLSRLFLVSVLAWGAVRGLGWRRQPALAAAVLLAALLFGAAHLPAALQIFPASSVVVARTLVLNLLLGVPFGWMFVRHGLEHAMVMHFAADISLHVVGPLLRGAAP